MKILIVDDSGFARKSIRAAVKTIFPTADFYPAGNGLAGYEMYTEQDRKQEKPDMVLLDHLMPEMDGLETLEKLMAYDPAAFVVFISANIQEPIRKRVLESGAKLFLNKPLKTSHLKQLEQAWQEFQTNPTSHRK